MSRLLKTRALHLLIAALFALSFVASACSSTGGGVPATPGEYSVQKDSVRFDGDRYQLYWADNNGSLHQLDTRKLRLVRDPDRTYLEVPQGGGDPVLHLREDEPVTVEGQDRQGAFSSPWFPFLLGATLGNAFGGRGGAGTVIINNPVPGDRSYDPNTATYRYPPTGTFGRDDVLHGSVDSSKPQTPDYSKIQPSPYATTGTASGTGGGAAASNKSIGASGPSTTAASGQSGGTGGGVAASSKGGFASGSQSYATRPTTNGGSDGVGAGSRGLLGGSSSTKPSSGGGAVTTTKPSGGSGITTTKPSGGISGGKGIRGGRAPSGRR